jgi:hypothetical protein
MSIPRYTQQEEGLRHFVYPRIQTDATCLTQTYLCLAKVEEFSKLIHLLTLYKIFTEPGCCVDRYCLPSILGSETSQSRFILGLSRKILSFVSLHIFGSNPSLSSRQSMYFNYVNDKALLKTKANDISTYKTYFPFF